MIRVALFFVSLALIAFGVGWLADRPGEVVLTWQGWRIETSVAVLAAAVLLLIVLVMSLWSLVRTILRSPDHFVTFLRNRRGVRGYTAISQGLVAVGSGDARAARKYAGEAERIAPGEPLALLLSAQSAQLSGDRPGAERAFRAMAARSDTKLLGLRGLFVEAQRRGDAHAARAYAEEAANTAPSLAWAGQAVLEFRCAAADWAGALATLENNFRAGLVDKPTYRRHRAVLLTARALAIRDSDPDRARALALEAVKLAPTLVPAAALAGRFLAEREDLRKASRVIETAWKANPHPDLAVTYAYLRFGDSARDRLARVQSLARRTPGDVEGAIAVARAAIDAQDFGTARIALAPLTGAPTQRVAMLMAELEQAEHGDEGRAREWMARAVRAARDPAWTADGFISDRWLPVSPVTGRIDAFEWKVPLAQLGGPVIEEDALPPPVAVAAGPVVTAAAPVPEPADVAPPSGSEPPPLPAAAAEEKPLVHSGADDKAAAEPADAAAGAAAGPRRRKPARKPEPVIPLVKAPDDPGPEPDPAQEPVPGPRPEAWR
jgi:HemY protein